MIVLKVQLYVTWDQLHGNDVAVDLVDTSVSIMADVAEQVIPSKQRCVLTSGGYMNHQHGWVCD